MKVPIVILAEDIRTSNYIDAHNCAITRAAQRVGVDGQHDGFNIVNMKGRKVARIKYHINERVQDMYRGAEEPQDIHTVITIEEG